MKQVHARFLFVPRSVSLSFSLFLYGHCGFHCDQLVHYRLPLCFEGSITLAAVTAGEKSGRIGSGTSKYDAGVEGWEGKKRRIINSENRAQFGKAGSKCRIRAKCGSNFFGDKSPSTNPKSNFFLALPFFIPPSFFDTYTISIFCKY